MMKMNRQRTQEEMVAKTMKMTYQHLKILRNYEKKIWTDDSDSESAEEEVKETTFDDMINDLNEKQDLVANLLDNLAIYCVEVKSALE